jgi:hypothetical protein
MLNVFCISDTSVNQPLETGLSTKSAEVVKLLFGRKGIKNYYMGTQTPDTIPIFNQYISECQVVSQ